MCTDIEKHVFISHNSNDNAFVLALDQELRQYGIVSWVDEAEILYGESLIQKVSDAIDSISLVIAVISKHSVSSNWVRQELDWAMTKEIKSNRVVVIPIVIDKCDIPFFLTNKLYADFTDKKAFKQSVAKLSESILYHSRRNNVPVTEPSVVFL